MLQDQGHLREQFLSYLLERMKEAEAAVDYAVKKQEEHQRCLAVKVCEAQALAQQHREGAFETAQMAAQSLQQMRTVRQCSELLKLMRRRRQQRRPQTRWCAPRRSTTPDCSS